MQEATLKQKEAICKRLSWTWDQASTLDTDTASEVISYYAAIHRQGMKGFDAIDMVNRRFQPGYGIKSVLIDESKGREPLKLW